MFNYANLASSALSFTKKYWKELLIILLAIVVYGKMRVDYSSLLSTFETAKESHQEQIEKISDIHEQELLARDKIVREYAERLVEVELKFVEDKEALVSSYKKRKEIYINTFGKDGLKNEIERYFGIEYVPPS
tara:strand:- start:150 stop:548 length:399 start_codon:yes stop_codon:yes gene_type:complete